MPEIATSNFIGGVAGSLNFAGVPSAGTSEVQTITFAGTITGGTFPLTFDGHTTAPIAWSATNATLVANIDSALEALPNIGSLGVVTAVGTAVAGIGTITVTFDGDNAAKAVPTMTTSSASLTGTGASVTVAETTPGVTATLRGAAKGSIVKDVDNGKLYVNTGSGRAPVYAVAGTQT